MDFGEYIKPELLVLIPVLYLIGAGLKKSKFKDTLIPLALGVISILLCAIYVFANTTAITSSDILTAIFTSVTQGILIAGASVYANQIIKQAKKDEV